MGPRPYPAPRALGGSGRKTQGGAGGGCCPSPAWTGALIAALLDLRLKLAVPAITAGVFLAGIIISLLTYGAAALL